MCSSGLCSRFSPLIWPSPELLLPVTPTPLICHPPSNARCTGKLVGLSHSLCGTKSQNPPPRNSQVFFEHHVFLGGLFWIFIGVGTCAREQGVFLLSSCLWVQGYILDVYSRNKINLAVYFVLWVQPPASRDWYACQIRRTLLLFHKILDSQVFFSVKKAEINSYTKCLVQKVCGSQLVLGVWAQHIYGKVVLCLHCEKGWNFNMFKFFWWN